MSKTFVYTLKKQVNKVSLTTRDHRISDKVLVIGNPFLNILLDKELPSISNTLLEEIVKLKSKIMNSPPPEFLANVLDVQFHSDKIDLRVNKLPHLWLLASYVMADRSPETATMEPIRLLKVRTQFSVRIGGAKYAIGVFKKNRYGQSFLDSPFSHLNASFGTTLWKIKKIVAQICRQNIKTDYAEPNLFAITTETDALGRISYTLHMDIVVDYMNFEAIRMRNPPFPISEEPESVSRTLQANARPMDPHFRTALFCIGMQYAGPNSNNPFIHHFSEPESINND